MNDENIILASSADAKITVRAAKDEVFTEQEVSSIADAINAFDGSEDVSQYLNTALEGLGFAFSTIIEDGSILASKSKPEIEVKNAERPYGKILEEREIASVPQKEQERGAVIQSSPPEVNLNINVQPSEPGKTAVESTPRTISPQPEIRTIPVESKETTNNLTKETSEITNIISSKSESFIQGVLTNLLQNVSSEKIETKLRDLITEVTSKEGRESESLFSQKVENKAETASATNLISSTIVPLISTIEEKVFSGISDSLSSLYTSMESQIKETSSTGPAPISAVPTNRVETISDFQRNMQSAKESIITSFSEMLSIPNEIKQAVISSGGGQNNVLNTAAAMNIIEQYGAAGEKRTPEITETNPLAPSPKFSTVNTIQEMLIGEAAVENKEKKAEPELNLTSGSIQPTAPTVTSTTETFFNALERVISNEIEVVEKIVPKELAENISQAIQNSVTNFQQANITATPTTGVVTPAAAALPGITISNPPLGTIEERPEETINVVSPMSVDNSSFATSRVVELSISSIKKLGAEIAKNMSLSSFLNEGR